MKASVVIDTTGLFCPIPVIKTSEAIKKIDVGAVVEVISDDPAIEHDMPAWCSSQGHTIEQLVREAGLYRYFIRKQKS